MQNLLNNYSKAKFYIVYTLVLYVQYLMLDSVVLLVLIFIVLLFQGE